MTKAQLDAVPAAERTLIVMLAHAANELNVLTKLFQFASTLGASNSLEEQARGTQLLVIQRIITGKVYECWGLLQSAFFGSRLSKTYAPQFDEAAQDALDGLKTYFSNTNAANTVRNGHAFHYDADRIAQGYATVLEKDSLDLYLAVANANTLYTFADTIAGRAMLHDIDPTDHRKAFETVMDDSRRVMTWFIELFAACMVIFMDRYFPGAMKGSEIVEISNAPSLSAVTIPYFVEVDDQ